MKNPVIISKLSIIENYLEKMNQYLPASLNDFKNNWGTQKIFERSLLVMSEAMIDISELIIARKNIIPPKTSIEAIENLKELGVIQNTEKYVKMIRLRNNIIHHYDLFDEDTLFSAITEDLNIFKVFIEEIKKYEKL